jgi:hypothetical protein
MINGTLGEQDARQGRWPDALQPPDPQHIAQMLAEFWRQLAQLSVLLPRGEHLLAEELTTQLRNLVLELMLALNGIRRPPLTANLNLYLSVSQRAALHKTLLLPEVSNESWIGRAVALVVIYRWYAPQLVARFAIDYPQTLEEATLSHLQQTLEEWPLVISTD